MGGRNEGGRLGGGGNSMHKAEDTEVSALLVDVIFSRTDASRNDFSTPYSSVHELLHLFLSLHLSLLSYFE